MIIDLLCIMLILLLWINMFLIISKNLLFWNSLECKCFWCGVPLSLLETSIDHVIPESLIEKPDELERIKINYHLPDNFEINNFCNWVPAHSNCNSRKSKNIFDNSPAFIFILQQLCRQSKKSELQYLRLIKRQKRERIIGKLMADIELANITDTDLIELLKLTNSRYSWKYNQIDKEKLIHVPEGWEVIEENARKGYLVITDGIGLATVPTNEEPDRTWFCYNCRSWGPWSGNRCINCGSWGEFNV